MKAKDLISALQQHVSPDAEVLFAPEGAEPIRIEGGIPSRNREDGRPVVLLTSLSLNQVGGF